MVILPVNGYILATYYMASWGDVKRRMQQIDIKNLVSAFLDFRAKQCQRMYRFGNFAKFSGLQAEIGKKGRGYGGKNAKGHAWGCR
jgi:hypothetical protein